MRKKRPGTLTPESFFSFSWRNTAVCIGILAAATGLCFLLRLLDDSDVYVALIFELAVVLVSRFTSGYFYGLLASVVGVIGVNYIFTYPYFAFNFTISGYPLTFLVMLAVSIVVSALTTQIKQQEKLRAEAEKEKMRGNLLRAVSHDIRTPLTSIVGGVNAILDSGDRMTPRRRPLCSPTSARRRNGSSAWWKICSPSRASPVRPPSIRSWRPGKSCSAPRASSSASVSRRSRSPSARRRSC